MGKPAFYQNNMEELLDYRYFTGNHLISNGKFHDVHSNGKIVVTCFPHLGKFF